MILIGLPVGLERSDQIPISAAACICVQTFKDLPPGRRIHMKISFPKGTEYESFRVETEIVWKVGHFWESWEEYHYASKFLNMLNGYYLKFREHFCGLSRMEEAPTRIYSHNGGTSI